MSARRNPARRSRSSSSTPAASAETPVKASGKSLDELIATSEVVICTGSGGVGKTTLAAVLASRAAATGRRAVVVTIDPAKRLADALGLEGIGNTPSRIKGDWAGELWAVMLDTKTTFDELVTKYSDPGQAERILANRFYRNISGALSGTQEYMAMEKLYELHDNSDFDVVVVDTPPTRNALDFLDAPRRLTRFLDHRLYRMITAPTRGMMRAVNAAAQAFIRSVSKVVGAEVLDDAVAFFQAFEGMEQGFRDRAAKVMDLLDDPSTAFVLVASPKRDTVQEAHYFAAKLAEAGIPVQALIVNRMHPQFASGLAEAYRERAHTLGDTDIGGLFDNLADFALVAARDEEHLVGLAEEVAPAPVVRVPFLDTDVHDLDGLAEVGEHLFAS
jgi:anion-transporting  ArsA/GET3 family ATPase